MLETPSQPARWPVIVAVLLLFAAMAPVLSVPQFARTLENLNVETAIEARRDGHWFIPTLEALPRTKKPPLTAWMTALSMRPATVANLRSWDPAVRAVAFRQLAWQVRWPALVQMGVVLIAVFFLGRGLGVGGEAALLCASGYMFLRYAQVSLTDIPLTLWVVVANAMFAVAVFGNRKWIGGIGAGVALGLAFLSKGPVAFGQTIAPWIIWAIWQRRSLKGAAGPLIAGVGAGLMVAVPWYLAIVLRDPHGQMKVWFNEVTGGDAPDRVEPFWWYFTFLPQFMPGLLFAIPGAWIAFKARRERPQLALVLLMVVVPFIIQCFFKDKKDRYILPICGPMAILAAVGLREGFMRWRNAGAATLYWVTLAAFPIGLAVLAGIGWPKGLRGPEGKPWFSWQLAAAAAVAGVIMFIGAIRSHQWRSERVALFTLMFMLLFMHLLTLGYYGRSSAGQSHMYPLAELIWSRYPDAELFTTEPFGRRASEDISIYTGRLTGWTTLDDMRKQTPGDRAKIVLIRERKGITPLPEAWKELSYLPREEGETWRAVVLPKR